MRTWKDSDPLPPLAIECLDSHGRRLPDFYADAYEEFISGTDADDDWEIILKRHAEKARAILGKKQT